MPLRWIVRLFACLLLLIAAFIINMSFVATSGPADGSALPLTEVQIASAEMITTKKLGLRQVFHIEGEETRFAIAENLTDDKPLQDSLSRVLVPGATVHIAYDPDWYKALGANPAGLSTPVQRLEADGTLIYDMFIYQEGRGAGVIWFTRIFATLIGIVGVMLLGLSFRR